MRAPILIRCRCWPCRPSCGRSAIQSDNLCDRAREHGDYATERLKEMQTRRRLIGDVRCPGLMVALTSFALAFSMVSLNTGVVTLFADPFTRVGGVGILLWLLVIPLVACIVAVYAHLSARIPVTGYAYQWSSRLVGKNFGWFTG